MADQKVWGGRESGTSQDVGDGELQCGWGRLNCKDEVGIHRELKKMTQMCLPISQKVCPESILGAFERFWGGAGGNWLASSAALPTGESKGVKGPCGRDARGLVGRRTNSPQSKAERNRDQKHDMHPVTSVNGVIGRRPNNRKAYIEGESRTTDMVRRDLEEEGDRYGTRRNEKKHKGSERGSGMLLQGQNSLIWDSPA